MIEVLIVDNESGEASEHQLDGDDFLLITSGQMYVDSHVKYQDGRVVQLVLKTGGGQ